MKSECGYEACMATARIGEVKRWFTPSEKSAQVVNLQRAKNSPENSPSRHCPQTAIA
jgi:hypothetical protein